MLVLAIIGVLMGIAIPKYQDYRERIKQAQAIQDIRVIQILVKSYAEDSGSYPASLATVGNGGKLDPWGRPYVYLDLTSPKNMGKARKDRRLFPLNSDFDLYSLGKDGVSAAPIGSAVSLDDVIRAAGGGFIGLAKRY